MCRLMFLFLSLFAFFGVEAKPKEAQPVKAVYLTCFNEHGQVTGRVFFDYRQGLVTHTFADGMSKSTYASFRPDIISYSFPDGQTFVIDRSSLVLNMRLSSIIAQWQCKKSVAAKTQI